MKFELNKKAVRLMAQLSAGGHPSELNYSQMLQNLKSNRPDFQPLNSPTVQTSKVQSSIFPDLPCKVYGKC